MLAQVLKFVPPEATAPKAVPTIPAPMGSLGEIGCDNADFAASAGAAEQMTLPCATEELIASDHTAGSDRTSYSKVADFLAECCTFAPKAWLPVADLFASYRSWSKARGQKIVSSKVFADAILAAGCRNSRSRRVAGRQTRTAEGLRLKSATSSPQLSPGQLSIVPAEGLARA
jgi:hypothetical protein